MFLIRFSYYFGLAMLNNILHRMVAENDIFAKCLTVTRSTRDKGLGNK